MLLSSCNTHSGYRGQKPSTGCVELCERQVRLFRIGLHSYGCLACAQRYVCNTGRNSLPLLRYTWPQSCSTMRYPRPLEKGHGGKPSAQKKKIWTVRRDAVISTLLMPFVDISNQILDLYESCPNPGAMKKENGSRGPTTEGVETTQNNTDEDKHAFREQMHDHHVVRTRRRFPRY
jgi:hypothetical protein